MSKLSCSDSHGKIEFNALADGRFEIDIELNDGRPIVGVILDPKQAETLLEWLIQELIKREPLFCKPDEAKLRDTKLYYSRFPDTRDTKLYYSRFPDTIEGIST